MEEDKSIKTIEDGQISDLDLDTKPDLKTENYDFELIGLKDPNDQRRFSRNFIKIDNLLKKLFSKVVKAGTGLLSTLGEDGENTISLKVATKEELGGVIIGENLIVDEGGKLHGNPAVDISGKQDKTDARLKTDAKTIVGAINENYEKFKNFCPFPVNSLFLTLGTENPHTLWLGTTWEKQEGRFLLGSSSSYAIGSTGGSSAITLTKANLPAEKLQLDSFSLGPGTQEITGRFAGEFGTYGTANNIIQGAFYPATGEFSSGNAGGGGSADRYVYFQASRTWTGMSTSAAPYTTNMGDSTPFNNMPPYLAVNIWKRLS